MTDIPISPPRADGFAVAGKTEEREVLPILLLCALGVYALALLSPAIFNDSDTFWHIRAGQWMIAHHAVLARDPFSLTFAGHPWETQEWLAEIAMALSYSTLAWSGVAILTGAAMGAAVLVLGLFLAERLDFQACLVVIVLAISCVMPDYLARPHILALPFMTAWIVGLARAAEARRAPSWFLLPVLVVWANLHGSFVFGLALIAPLAVEAILAEEEATGRLRALKAWGLFALLSVAAAFVNPFGVNGLIYPFVLMKVQSLSFIGEWQPLDLQHFSSVELAIFATLFFLIWRGVRVPPLRLLVALVLIHLSVLHARYGMVFGISAAILLAAPLARTSGPGVPVSRASLYRGLAILAAVIAVSATARTLYPIRRSEGPMAPASALRAVPRSLAALPVFNDYAFGGYLIFKGVKPFIDSRADLYGDAYLRSYARAINGDGATVDQLFGKYRVAWTMLKPGDPLIATLAERGWHRRYADAFAVVQVNPAINAVSPH